MTAQRTTLLSLCILLITLAGHPPPDGEKVMFLTTNVGVEFSYALKALIVVVAVNALSYGLRFYAEYKQVLSENAFNQMKSLVAASEQAHAEFFGERQAEKAMKLAVEYGNKLGDKENHENLQFMFKIIHEAARQLEAWRNIGHGYTEKFKMRRDWASRRDWFFDFLLPCGLSLFSVGYGIYLLP